VVSTDKTAAKKLSMLHIQEAYAIGNEAMRVVDIPVLLAVADEPGESVPRMEFPFFHTKEKDGYYSVIVAPKLRRGFDNKVSDGHKFHWVEKIARMTITDVEADLLNSNEDLLPEILLFMKQPVEVTNPRSGFKTVVRTGQRDAIELLDPTPKEFSPEAVAPPSAVPQTPDMDKLKKGKTK